PVFCSTRFLTSTWRKVCIGATQDAAGTGCPAPMINRNVSARLIPGIIHTAAAAASTAMILFMVSPSAVDFLWSAARTRKPVAGGPVPPDTPPTILRRRAPGLPGQRGQQRLHQRPELLGGGRAQACPQRVDEVLHLGSRARGIRP